MDAAESELYALYLGFRKTFHQGSTWALQAAES